jgi:hypothetical protein
MALPVLWREDMRANSKGKKLIMKTEKLRTLGDELAHVNGGDASAGLTGVGSRACPTGGCVPTHSCR